MTKRSTALLLVFVPLLVLAQEPQGKGPPVVATPFTEVDVVRKVNAATDRALDYLASKQIKDGPNAGAWRPDANAMNSLAILAFLLRGHIPGRGRFGDTRDKDGGFQPGVLTLAKQFVLQKANANWKAKSAPEGYLTIGGGQMYEHGLTTLALAELYGQDPDPDLEDALRKSVNLILKSQGPRGGWNYGPSAVDGDLSVSVMQIVAMRAARNAEIPVPDAAVKKAIAYVRGMSAGKKLPGYGYAGPGTGTVQTSAAGVLSLQLLGAHEDENIPVTLDWISKSVKPQWDNGGPSYFYYFHYYAMQGFYQHGGKLWNDWHGPVREMLLSKQNSDGSWGTPAGSAEASIDPQQKIYSTAPATLVLNIYQHFLPAYQR